MKPFRVILHPDGSSVEFSADSATFVPGEGLIFYVGGEKVAQFIAFKQ